jgi:glycosyltransferase involved in cell wall biosynthesis
MNYRFFVIFLCVVLGCAKSPLHRSNIAPCPYPKVAGKVLICGVCRNVAHALANTRSSIQELGSQFIDYRVIIYENNSTDQTKAFLRAWEKEDPRLILISEQLSSKRMVAESKMKRSHRIEKISRARNIVLDHAMDPYFDDYKYVIWADLDFIKPWDVAGVVETIVHPEQEWDAVFAYGAYDLFALRFPESPIGLELLGASYWRRLDEVRHLFALKETDSWKKVYSAFGGLGIYKREALRGCRYSAVVTKDLEKVVCQWLSNAERGSPPPFFKDYQEKVKTSEIVQLSTRLLEHREGYPEEVGIQFPQGKVVWFSCSEDTTLPWTCEHVPLHASMVVHGFDRLFVNPRLRCDP